MSEASISAAMVLRLVQLLERRSLDPQPLLEAAGLSRAVLELDRARVPYSAADQLLELAATLIPRNELGLALGLTRVDEAYGVAGLLLLTAPSFRQGLRRALGYQRLWGDGERFQLHWAGNDCAVSFRHPGPSPLAGAIVTECAFVEILEGARALLDPDAIPRSVEFSHEKPADTLALGDYFRLEPRFSCAQSRIVLSAELADRPLHAVRDLLSQAIERQAARALSFLPRSESMAERTKPLLAGEVGVTRSLAQAATLLRVSPRTLQRRLQREGTSFDALLDTARRELLEVLESQGVPPKELPFRLGFQDPSALARARRRWQTPKRLRPRTA